MEAVSVDDEVVVVGFDSATGARATTLGVDGCAVGGFAAKLTLPLAAFAPTFAIYQNEMNYIKTNWRVLRAEGRFTEPVVVACVRMQIFGTVVGGYEFRNNTAKQTNHKTNTNERMSTRVLFSTNKKRRSNEPAKESPEALPDSTDALLGVLLLLADGGRAVAVAAAAPTWNAAPRI